MKTWTVTGMDFFCPFFNYREVGSLFPPEGAPSGGRVSLRKFPASADRRDLGTCPDYKYGNIFGQYAVTLFLN